LPDILSCAFTEPVEVSKDAWFDGAHHVHFTVGALLAAPII